MLLIFYKPYGVLSQFSEQVPGQKTLRLFGFPKDVYPIGRLDMDSEGLLLLSDEKAWTDRLLNPKHAHERIYHVQVEGQINVEALRSLERGINIGGIKTRPCKARLIHPEYAERQPPIRFRKAIPTSWLELILTEGKNRQVRRMTAAVGFPTLRLIRIGIGKFSDPRLKEGMWRELTAQEKILLRESQSIER